MHPLLYSFQFRKTHMIIIKIVLLNVFTFFKVIFMDIKMSPLDGEKEMDGMEATKLIRMEYMKKF